MAVEANEYKLAKEAFVANLPGTSFLEVTVLVSLFVLVQWTHSMIREALGTMFHLPHSSSGLTGNLLEFLLEYILIIFPLVTSVTYTETVPVLVVLWIAMGLTGSILRKPVTQIQLLSLLNKSRLRPDHISWFRSCILIITTISILAVDFVVYPRRLAKTETYGTGLMDVGVGCFVLSNAVVSKRATRTYSSVSSTVNSPPTQSLFQIIRGVLPLLVLGTARMIGTKGIEYQEHHSEYGIHWNFFYTIAVLGISVGVFDKMFPSAMGAATTAVIGLMITIGYQVWLANYGLRDWLLNAPRENLISMNKEGLCSAIGYLGTYLIGTWLGSIQVPSATEELDEDSMKKYSGTLLRPWRVRAAQLWAVTGILWCATLWTNSNVDRISRRMANLPYVLWVLSGTSQLLAMFLTIRVVCLISMLHQSRIIQGVSQNQLVVFLVANLFTGAVNLAMQTIYADPFTGYVVILLYMVAVSGFSFVLNVMDIKIKM